MSMRSIGRLARSAGFWKSVVGVVAMGGLMAWASGGCGPKIEPGRLPGSAGVAVGPDDEVLAAAAEQVSARIDLSGTAESETAIRLSSRIPAYVREVLVSAGSSVRAGQPLVVLDDRDIREQLSAAEAQLKQAEAEFNRTKQLRATGAATEQAYVAAESALSAAQAQVAGAKVMLTYAVIASPIDGIVTDRRIEPGDLAGPGVVLASVYDPARMRLETPVPVRLVDKLPRGQEVEVVFSRPDRTVRGVVTEIVSEIDPRSRTRTVKIRLDDAQGDILPGTFGRIWVEEGRHEAVVVPASAVMRVGQLEYVQVVSEGRALRRLVRTLALPDGRLEVASGLAAGERILAKPRVEG